MDAVVTVHRLDPDGGPLVGATITLTAYRDSAAPILVATAKTDAMGDATLNRIARPSDGAPAALLDVRSDRTSSAVDTNGCTETSSWSAGSDGLPAAPVVDGVLEPAARSVSIDCAERIGDVLAASGRPQVTLPATDAGPSVTTVDGGSPTVAALLILGGVAIVVPLRTRSAQTRRRRRR
jgi:hypothetical protein